MFHSFDGGKLKGENNKSQTHLLLLAIRAEDFLDRRNYLASMPHKPFAQMPILNPKVF